MSVPLLDLTRQFATLENELLEAVAKVCRSQQFILGPAVEAFEKAVAEHTGTRHAIGVSSGTDGQLAGLMALEYGVGDSVITTPYTFFATAGGIARVGARSLFVDIDPHTYNLSISALERFLHEDCKLDAHDQLRHIASGTRVRAILPVHLFGCCAEMTAIHALANRYQLDVIEDSAQAMSAEFVDAEGKVRRAGAMSRFSWFSFFPSKNLGGFGDGGVITLDDDALADRLRSLRNHGMDRQYHYREVGGNFRLDALQAAVLSVKLPHLDAWSAARRRNAAIYRNCFAERGLSPGTVILPTEPYADSGAVLHHIYNQFVIRVPKSDALREFLTKQGVGCAVYYPLPLHLQPCFDSLGGKPGDFPEAERAAEETLALPIFPELADEEIEWVAEKIAEFYRR